MVRRYNTALEYIRLCKINQNLSNNLQKYKPLHGGVSMGSRGSAEPITFQGWICRTHHFYGCIKKIEDFILKK